MFPFNKKSVLSQDESAVPKSWLPPPGPLLGIARKGEQSQGLPGCSSLNTLRWSFSLDQHCVLLSGYCRKSFPPVDEQPVVNNHHHHSHHFPLLPNLPWFHPAVVYGLLKISSLPVLLQGAKWSSFEHHLPYGLMFPSPYDLGQRYPVPSASITPSPGCLCFHLGV